MTIAAFVQTPAYVIQGTGPYQISHPYAQGAIVAQVLIDSVPVELDMSAITVVPVSSLTQGNLYLSAEQASQYAGLTLWIDRDTAALQGWEARYGDREVGMETQLDRDTMALQELRAAVNASLRGRSEMAPYLPTAGSVPMVRADGQGWENGPTASAIAAAQSAALLALVGGSVGFDTISQMQQNALVYGPNTVVHPYFSGDTIVTLDGETVTYLGEVVTVEGHDVIVTITAGDVWAVKTGAAYVVLAQGVGSYDVLTAGGVKLQRLPMTGLVAAEVEYTPASGITATNVQAAIAQVRAALSDFEAETGAWSTQAIREFGRVSVLQPIVAAGSSTFAGSITSIYPEWGNPSEDNGWKSNPASVMGLLDAWVTEHGGRMWNRSVPGRDLQDVIDNFWTEIAIYRPKTIIIGTGYTNEAGSSARLKAYYYQSHLSQIKGMCESIGARLIVAGLNPYNTNTVAIRNGMYDVKRWCNVNKVRLWDFSSATFGDNYAYADDISNPDGIHGNDAGHQLFFEACTLADLYAPGREHKIEKVTGYVVKTTSAADYSGAPIRYSIDNADMLPKSWSVLVEARSPGTSASTTIMQVVTSSGSLRLRWINTTSNWQIVDGSDTILLSISASGNIPDPTSDTDAHVYFVSYDHRTKRLYAYIDWTEIGNVSTEIGGSLQAVNVLAKQGEAPTVDWQISEFAAWGATYHDPGHLLILQNGQYLVGGLLCYADMTQIGVASIPDLNNGAYAIQINDAGTRSVAD